METNSVCETVSWTRFKDLPANMGREKAIDYLLDWRLQLMKHRDACDCDHDFTYMQQELDATDQILTNIVF